ncbi:MAG: sugar phosphate isomerase/epimerase and 4-hydroxyphenylpyruvate domain-containing protein, partial [Trebonia sp.]
AGPRAVQHVAIRSADIVATARAAAAQGLSVLPIPGNYYEDLEARHALDAASLETYRRYNILYDEDAAGHAFRQFWVTVPRASVLFEIVDREAGYEGYGTVNATVRMTAQETR